MDQREDPEGISSREKSSEVARLRRANRALMAQLEELRSAAPVDETLHRRVVATISEGIVVQDLEGTVVMCNPAAERILGLTLDEMMGRTSTDPRWRAVHEDGSPFEGAEHPAMVTLRTEEPRHDVVMGIHKPDGTLTWISIHTEPLVHQPGDGPYGVVATFTDITAFERTTAALRRSEERLRLALRSGGMGTWEWDVASSEVSWSEEVPDILGVEPTEWDGTYAGYLELVHPDDRETVTGALRAALEEDLPYHVLHRVRSRDGTRWVECRGQVVRDAEGRPGRMIGTVQDVTAAKSLEAQLLAAQKMESLGRLAGGVAHDFNNLLTAILGCSDLELDRTSDERSKASLHEIRDAAERARRLTRQLLSMASRQVLELSVFDLSGLVLSSERLLERLVGERVTVRTGASARWPVRADVGQLEQVLLNLAVNAREAMPDGGTLTLETADVTLSDAPDLDLPPGDYVRVRVADTGTGMGPETLARAFEPFYTTKKSGSGLGLSTCYGIVMQLGGRIVVQSEEGVGTTFDIWLPRSHAELTPTHGEPATRPDGGATVLVVEDDPAVRRVLVAGLTDADHRVVATHGAEDALRLARDLDDPIDLLVTDVVMPGGSGWELAERFEGLRPDCGVLFISGYATDVLREHGVDPSRIELLSKPFTATELVERVEGLLEPR